MKKQIVMTAIALSALVMTSNAQDKKAAAETKKPTTATAKEVRSKDAKAVQSKATAAPKDTKMSEAKKVNK